jgi:hypothetical protein
MKAHGLPSDTLGPVTTSESSMHCSPCKEPPQPPATGESIYTLDGHRLGSVGEVRGRYFQLRRRFRRDLWLAVDSLLPTPIRGRTVTRFGADVLHRYCLTAQPTGTKNDRTPAAA